MQSRLRMAALAIVAALAGAGTARAGDAPVENKVSLDLQITGLGRGGCSIEIKPGHAACKFEKVEKAVKPDAVTEPLKLDTIAIDARSSSADRDCSFVITVKEPGRKPITFRRGVRLSRAEVGGPTPEQNRKFVLNLSAIAAKDEPKTPRR